MKAARIHQTGDASVLTIEDIESPSPAEGQVKIQQHFSGLNFIDIYMRNGLYPVSGFPAVLGMEAAGIVTEVGAGVDLFNEGDRVAYVMHPGSYGEERVIDADQLVPLPDPIDDRLAGAIMLKGLTAHYLLFRTYQVQPGDSILVYAAAGGVGSLLSQWGNHIGATVIGCVGDEDKAKLALANGCHHTILYKEQNIPQAVRELTDGEGVHVVYDAVGKATFEASLDSLRPFGTVVSYGNASGAVEPFNPGILAPKGSLYVTRPTLGTHVSTRDLLLDGANALFAALQDKIITPAIKQSWKLDQIAQAHQTLEAGHTTGLSVIEI